MKEQMESRLTELNRDYQLGQGRLAELEREAGALRETLLRIGGAIRVLEELLGTERAGANGQRPEPEAVHVP
jgi:prefoldin subunit 5